MPIRPYTPNPFLPESWQDPATDATMMVSPIGMAAAPAKGGWNLLSGLLNRVGGRTAPITAVGAPSAERALDPLFTANERAGMAEIERIYERYMGHPIRLGVQEERLTANAGMRGILDRFQRGLDPDTFQHVKNAFLEGMRYAGKEMK